MDSVRIDKWLWAARFFKTRGVALTALKGGKIELNGHKPKASKTLSEGDQLKISQPHRQVEVTVLMVSDKRGSAEHAQALYHVDQERLNQTEPSPMMALAGYREKGKGRPTKRERRKMEGWMKP